MDTMETNGCFRDCLGVKELCRLTVPVTKRLNGQTVRGNKEHTKVYKCHSEGLVLVVYQHQITLHLASGQSEQC